jgi:transcription initiation factor IIE alpha subunit
MEDYKLPERTLTEKAIIKTSSAVGIYFVCPACHMELLYPDERFGGLKECPMCHTDLRTPVGKEKDLVIRRAMDAFIP